MREVSEKRTGVWLLGASGGLATTLVAGCRAIAKGLVGPTGLLTESPELQPMQFQPLGQLRFGGHEIRSADLLASAREIAAQNHSIRQEWVSELEGDLDAVSRAVRPGIRVGCGSVVEAMSSADQRSFRSGREAVSALSEDLRGFREDQGVTRVIVVNLASTEAPVDWTTEYRDLDALDRALDRSPPDHFRAGLLYAYAAFQAGAAYLNFTPSNSPLCPATEALAAREGVPYFGNDGKTGETLVKSALAPMFKYRNLRVDSWTGFNLLGNRDGEVLADQDHKRSKVATKDSVLGSILGYPLQTHVGIDYVKSLGDQKVAWDFIHFRGFLDHAMSMQFTWHGCDNVLAAPVVLDLVRLLEDAFGAGAVGPQTQLACFFKSPLHCAEHDLHRQVNLLSDYLVSRSATL